MLGEQLKQVLEKAYIAAAGLLSGVSLALILMQYPGVLEVRLNEEEWAVTVDGNPMCKQIQEAKEE